MDERRRPSKTLHSLDILVSSTSKEWHLGDTSYSQTNILEFSVDTKKNVPVALTEAKSNDHSWI